MNQNNNENRRVHTKSFIYCTGTGHCPSKGYHRNQWTNNKFVEYQNSKLKIWNFNFVEKVINLTCHFHLTLPGYYIALFRKFDTVSHSYTFALAIHSLSNTDVFL